MVTTDHANWVLSHSRDLHPVVSFWQGPFPILVYLARFRASRFVPLTTLEAIVLQT